MKHKYTTCDRCGKRIDAIFPKDSIWGIYVGMKEIKCKPDVTEMHLAIQRGSDEFNEGFPVFVSYDGYIHKKEYELCCSCAKELRVFLKAKNDGEGE